MRQTGALVMNSYMADINPRYVVNICDIDTIY